MPLSWAIPIGGALLGGLMGSKEKTTGKTNPTSSTTTSSGSHGSSTQQKIDPRMEAAIYGAGGIMPNASAWYMQNQTGMNDKMLTGLNNQWAQLGASPQGFNQMQNLGMGLMGGGSSGNPFTGGGGMNNLGSGVAQSPTAYQPAAMNNAPAFAMPTPAAAPAMLPAYDGGGGGYSEPTPTGGEQKAPVDHAGRRVGLGGLGGQGRGEWLEDTEGMGYWSGDRSAGGYTGYRGDAYSPAPAYQFNNGYTAYGADGTNGGGF